MSDNIVALRSGLALAQPSEDVIECLERLLEKARSGEIRAIAYATVVDPTGSGNPANVSLSTGWDSAYEMKFMTAAAIGLLGHRYNDDLLGKG